MTFSGFSPVIRTRVPDFGRDVLKDDRFQMSMVLPDLECKF